MHRHWPVVVLIAALVIRPGAAQEPVPPATAPPATGAPQATDAPQAAEIPRDSASDSAAEDRENQVVVPLSEPARRWIEQALRQQAIDPTAPPRSTGDPILDDVLDVIRRQGSLLDGSSLDPRSEAPDTLPREVDPSDRVPPPPSPGLPGLELPAVAQHPDARFHAAESLLRAARELAALGSRDRASNELIAAMREQATMLLVDEYSEVLQRIED